MLERIPTVLTAQEVLDKAFQRSLKLDIPDPVRYHRIRKTETARMQCVVDVVVEALGKYPKRFPSLERMSAYEREVLDIIVGLPKLHKALGSVRWASDQVRKIGHDATQKMLRVRTVEGVKRVQNACYGRLSSVAYEVDPDLDVLRETRDRARKLPTVDPGCATIVIAGPPNVGKSTLLRAWTKSKAEVADYAFTTKQAEVGHFERVDAHGVETKYQIVDTPGLLDRPDEERNDVERQAVAALRHAADVVLFLLDPSETCGYLLPDQEHLLADIKAAMLGLPFIVAETKADLVRRAEAEHAISVETGDGVAALQDALIEAIGELGPDLEIDPLDAWHEPAEEEEAWPERAPGT